MKKIFCFVEENVRKYPELLAIPIGFVVWVLSIRVFRWFDPTSGVFDAGVFQIPIFVVIQFFIFISIAVGCPPDGVVLDPFMGAGTTALVARELGRNYVGIELNEEYVKMARGRLGARACASEKG